MPDWLHLRDGTLCVAGHDPTTMLCAEGGGPVWQRCGAVSPLTGTQCVRPSHSHGRHVAQVLWADD